MRISSLILILSVYAFPITAQALTQTEHVTKKYALRNPSLISVKVLEKKGMVAFTIEFKHKKAKHVVVYMKVSDGTRTFSESRTPMFTVTEKSRYYFSVPIEHIRTSTYSLGVSGVTREHAEFESLPWSRHYKSSFKPLEESSELTPNVGSIIYAICLSDFVSPNVPNDSCTQGLVLPVDLQ